MNATTKTPACPDCGKPDAVTFGDGGCLARCKELSFRTDVRCKIDTIARLRSEVVALLAARESTWEEGYGSGWSDSRYARWGTHPNPHSSTETVLAKQGKAKDRPLAAHLARASEPTLGPIRVRLEETQKGPPIQDIQDDRLIWYVHVNEPDGNWHLAGSGPMFRRDAEALAQRFRDVERTVSIGTHPEKMGP